MAGLIPRAVINELLARSDIVESIDARVPLRKKGANYTACCPFHNEKTPSFTVSPSKQFYHCFGCGASGNIISFLMEYEHLSFVEAVEQLANQLGVSLPQISTANTEPKSGHLEIYALLKEAAAYYQQQLRQSTSAINYLKSRGLLGKTAQEFTIGYAPDGWDNLIKRLGSSSQRLQLLDAAGLVIKKNESNGYYDRFRERIMFPLRDRQGRVIAFGGRVITAGEPKYLNSPETVVFHKGSELYGLYEATQAVRTFSWLLVVEGYMDVVMLAQHGIQNVVATLGTATTAEHIQRLMRLSQEIIFCFDGDQAGQAAAWRALETFLPVLQDGWQVRFLILPQGEDPDSLVQQEGAEPFQARCRQATSLADFLYAHLLKQLDITTMEGKARLTKLALPLVQKLPANVLQQLLLARLASLVRTDVASLYTLARQQAGGKKQALPNVAPAEQRSTFSAKRSPMRLAIALLVQYPHLAVSITTQTSLLQLSLAGSELLVEVINLLKQNPDLNTAALLEYWRDKPEYNQMALLASLPINIPAEGLEQELLGVCARLLHLTREQEMERLLQKATLNQLSLEEKHKLQELIAATKTVIN